MTLLNAFELFVEQQSLIQRHDSVLACVSGGLDSVVLLDLLSSLREHLGFKLSIVHVNHSLRSESDCDEFFVSGLARKYGLPFFSIKVAIRERAVQSKESIEEAARAARYAYFKILCKSICGTKIATGHHADDQAETILMNLIRGTGIRGLRGIQPIKENLIRPLLFASREQLRTYCEQHHLTYVTDASNQDTRFFRNKIRLDYLSRLKDDFGTQVVQSINRAGQALSEIEDYVNDGVEKALTSCVIRNTDREIVLDIYEFLKYFTAIQKGMIFRLLYHCNGYQKRLQATDIQQILNLALNGKSGSLFRISDILTVYKTTHDLAFVRTLEAKTRIPININQINYCPEWEFDLKTRVSEAKQEQAFSSSRFIEKVNYQKIKGQLVLRPVQPGDVFIPLGMKGKKKLQDFLVDLRIPVYQREHVPVLADEENIIWVVGYRIHNDYKIQENTRNILELEVLTRTNNLRDKEQ